MVECYGVRDGVTGVKLKWQPSQPHPGTRENGYRCSLPGLAEFTIYRCEGTVRTTIKCLNEGGAYCRQNWTHKQARSFFMTKLFSKIEGQGPTLVLLHGLFGSAGNMGAIVRALRCEYCIHSIDLRNHGRSFHSVDINLKLMAEDISLYCGEHKLGQVNLLGHSLGGKVAMQVALDYPELVDKLIVADIAPVMYPPKHDKIFAGLKAVARQNIASRSAANDILGGYINDGAVRSFLLKSLVRNASGAYHWRFNLKSISKHYDELSKENSGDHYLGRTLFIKGADSDYILPEHQNAIELLFPIAQYRIINGAGHWLHMDKPELFSSIVRRFLKES